MAHTNLTGQRFGRLAVLREDGRLRLGIAWLCACDCGAETRATNSALKSGKTKSCGCLRRDTAASTSPATRIDLSPGERFGRWTVIGPCPKRAGQQHVRWLCQCDCGSTRDIKGTILKNGRSKGCATCASSDAMTRMSTRHGMYGTPLYRIWSGIKNRCCDVKNKSYHRYGGRGIKLCDRWLDFKNFHADIPPRPSKQHTLDRKDNNKGYEPGNVRWATPKEQGNNRTTNVWHTYKGETRTVAQWAEVAPVNLSSLRGRLAAGWTIDEALEVPHLGRATSVVPFVDRTPRLKSRAADRTALFAAYKGRCAICNEPIDPNGKWIDEHLVPIVRGGPNCLSNRGPVHVGCAIAKTRDDVRVHAKIRRDLARRLSVA